MGKSEVIRKRRPGLGPFGPLIPFGHPCNLSSTAVEFRAFRIKYGKEPWYPEAAKQKIASSQ